MNGLVGKRLVYTYANGWEYELYIKNETTIDYRIHSGMVGGRWVKDQPVTLGTLDDGVHTVSWTEPTGTSVATTFDLPQLRSHGTIFFPRWVADDPQTTVCFQNDHLDEMYRHRDAGPTYPIEVVDENSTFTLVDEPGPDDRTRWTTTALDDGARIAGVGDVRPESREDACETAEIRVDVDTDLRLLHAARAPDS